MKAMLFEGVGQPLRLAQIPTPQPASGQVLLRVAACGVCHTDLHIVDGELAQPKLPLVLGHQIAGRVVALGAGVTRFQVGQRLGVPWLGYTDGDCRFCRKDQENLCDNARFTGYTLDGGFAGYAVADERYCFPLPETYNDTEAAPLLCAGLIGYRTYRMAGEGIERLGLYGFGAAAHIIAQVAVYRGQRVYAFTRPGRPDSSGVRLEPGSCLGWQLDPGAAAAAGRCPDLRPGWVAGGGGAQTCRQRRRGRVRRHPHERYPIFRL
jgi:alcohol dehydrogenase, propanol-preferring